METSNPKSSDSRWTLEDLVQNMARSSMVEYEIGRLVSQALDMVGDLITLSSQRIEIHAAVAEDDPQSLDMEKVHSALRQALFEAFTAQPLTQPATALHNSPCDVRTTLTRLTTHQLQEVGAAFGRDLSTLRPAVQRMWDSGSSCPDLTSVVTQPSPLLTIY